MILTRFIFMQKFYLNQNMHFWSKNCENTGIKHLNNPKAFIEFSSTGWCLLEYWWLQSKQKKKIFNCVQWYDFRYYQWQQISSCCERIVY